MSELVNREEGRRQEGNEVRGDGAVVLPIESDAANMTVPAEPPGQAVNRGDSTPAAQTQTLWATLLIEELVRRGVGLFVLAPGSRCTPLTAAVAANPDARNLLHFDERGGAFAALGFARASGTPAVWVTTSGTAVANGLPAVVEADADGVPLILLTADRPPELRETGANQTIRQPGIFGSFIRWQFDLPVPDPAIDPAFVLSTVGQAVHRSMSPAGPVHLNCMFREPLEPQELKKATMPASLNEWLANGRAFTRYPASRSAVSAAEIDRLATRLEGIERGLVVAGKSDDSRTSVAARKLANSLGWPLFCDVASGARFGSVGSPVVHEIVLASPKFCDRRIPEAIVHLGGRFTSKRLQQYFQASRPKAHVVVSPDPFRRDPGHTVTDRIQSDVSFFCDALCAEMVPTSSESDWLRLWKVASDAAEHAVERALNVDSLSEPGVSHELSRLSPKGRGLVIASSMPIRDMDLFAVRNGPNLRVTANRGASGIDGTVATAAGFARGLDQATTLLIGDLALLHDLNSLAILRDGPPVTIVVINNDGGGIFSFLPIAERQDLFEPFFGTPHGLGFEDAAKMFGLTYTRPTTMSEFVSAYRKAVAAAGPSIIEVRTNRQENVAVHRRLISTAKKAIEEAIAA